jgi:hypothetical protein
VSLNPYSVLIFEASANAGVGGAIGGPPSGYIYVITDVATWQTYASGAYIAVWDSKASVNFVVTYPSSSSSYGHWTGRQVVPQGVNLAWEPVASAGGIRICGYQLEILSGS